MKDLGLSFKKQIVFVLYFLFFFENCFAPRYSGLGPEVVFDPGSGRATNSRSTAFARIYSKLFDLDLNDFNLDHSYWTYKEGHSEEFSSLNIVWNPNSNIRSDTQNLGSRRGWNDHKNLKPEIAINALGRAEFWNNGDSLKFYMGALFGRLYFVRKLKNTYVWASNNISSSGSSSYSFNNGIAENNRFFLQNKLTAFTGSNNFQSILSTFVNVPTTSFAGKKIKIISANNSTEPVLLTTDDGNIVIFNNLSDKTSVGTFVNTTTFGSTDLQPLNSFAGIVPYRVNTKSYDNGKLNPNDSYSDLIGTRCNATTQPRYSYQIDNVNPFQVSDFINKYYIPTVVPKSQNILLIGLAAQIRLMKIDISQDDSSPSGEMKTYFRPYQLLCAKRATFLDVAASENYIAAIGIGRQEPTDQNVSQANFDSYDSRNYFCYLKVSKNINLNGFDGSANSLSAERGREGQNTDDIDPRVFCMDKDLPSEDGFINFVSFDSKENLFILTSQGKLYFYSAAMLAADGKKLPIKIDCPFPIVSFSAGKGLVVSDTNGKLFYVSDVDVAKISNTQKTVNWKALPDVFQSVVFELLADGSLLFAPRYDDGKLYMASQTQFFESIESLFKNITATDPNSYKTRLLIFCHLVLNRPNRIYGGLTALPEKNYPIVDGVELALILIEQVNSFFSNVPDSVLDNNLALIEDISSAIDVLKTTYGKNDSFSAAFASFQTMISQNKYFQDRSLRQKLKKINSILKASNSTDFLTLKGLIDDLVNNNAFINNKSGFNSVSDLLSSTVDGDVSTGKMGCSILLEWLRSNKSALLAVSGISQAVHQAWVDLLFNIEQKVYLNPSDSGTAQGLLANIASGIKILEEDQLKDSLTSPDKNILLATLQNIIDSVNFLKVEELNEVKEKLTFLNSKFKLDQDPVFTVKGINLVSRVFEKLKIDFGVQYFIAQFKTMVVSLSNLDATKTADIKSLITNICSGPLKQIVKLKADFEIRTFSDKDVDKTAFVNYVLDLITKDKNFKAYEDQVSKTTFNENLFALQIELLKDGSVVSDYVALFSEWSKLTSDDLAKNDQFGVACKNALNKLSTNKSYLLISAQDGNIINGGIDSLLGKGVTGIEKINQAAYTSDFTLYLNNLLSIINSNKDNSSKSWSVNALTIPKNNNVNFFNFVKIVQDYAKFSPDFSNDNHKYGFLSILNFVKKSIVSLKQNIDQSSLNFLRLDNCLTIVNNVSNTILGASGSSSVSAATQVLSQAPVKGSGAAPNPANSNDF